MGDQSDSRCLTNATLLYALDIVNKGWKRAIEEDGALAKGVNVVNGKVTYKAVAEAHNLEHVPLAKAL